MAEINKKILKELFLNMLNVRVAEEKIVELYHGKMMRTPTHLSIGQEAVAVGVCGAINSDDQVFASHRCHAAILARGGDLDGFFAELCGRENGICKGRAGSAHLTDKRIGVYASPILASMIPVAVGAALSFKMDKKKKIAVAFMGDAAFEEGVFAESLNFAALMKLPVLFICENNLYSTHSPLKARQPSSPIYKRVKLPEIKTKQIDGNDVVEVFKATQESIKECRSGKGPAFIECLTYRIKEHVGPLDDYDKGYRSKSEVDFWLKKCPIKRMRKIIVKKGILNNEEIDTLLIQLDKRSEDSYRNALNSPWPKAESLLDDVY